jgi:hypothetical protein
LVLAGTDGYRANIRLMDERDRFLKNYSPDDGKFT